MIEALSTPFARLLLQLLLIVGASQILGKLLQSLRQPAVIGEVMAGILLGPSLFGLLFPGSFQFVFAPNSLGILQVVSQLGLILFMFTVGLHTKPFGWGSTEKKALFISMMSIAVPFALGLLIARPLYNAFASPEIPFLTFALFSGISFSITAFPVLARIIHDRKIASLPTAKMALACAAIDDASAWIILAGIVGFTKNSNPSQMLWTLGTSVAGVFVLLKIVAPFLNRQVEKGALTEKSQFIAGVMVLLASALYFEWTGVHALFGAFLAGTAMPTNPKYREFLQLRVESLGGLILLPAFFAVTGLRTQISLLDSPAAIATCAGIILIAILGKLGGGMLASRYCGYSWKDASFIGILMNTRGLMELVVLNIGLELGIIPASLFTMMVIMALVTTVMTGPCLDLLTSTRRSISPRP